MYCIIAVTNHLLQRDHKLNVLLLEANQTDAESKWRVVQVLKNCSCTDEAKIQADLLNLSDVEDLTQGCELSYKIEEAVLNYYLFTAINKILDRLTF